MKSKYSLSKTCKVCNHEFGVRLNKIESAFTQFINVAVHTPCPKCGNTEYSICSRQPPMIDEELMRLWVNNGDLQFFEQDEDLMLADIENLELIRQSVFSEYILPLKRHTLISALCIMIYDKSNGWQKALEFLKQNQTLVQEAKSFIYAYIGKKVFPKLGLKW